MGIVI